MEKIGSEDLGVFHDLYEVYSFFWWKLAGLQFGDWGPIAVEDVICQAINMVINTPEGLARVVNVATDETDQHGRHTVNVAAVPMDDGRGYALALCWECTCDVGQVFRLGVCSVGVGESGVQTIAYALTMYCSPDLPAHLAALADWVRQNSPKERGERAEPGWMELGESWPGPDLQMLDHPI